MTSTAETPWNDYNQIDRPALPYHAGRRATVTVVVLSWIGIELHCHDD
jgi:hypothetical protein